MPRSLPPRPSSARQRSQAEPGAEDSSLVDELFTSWAYWREACEDARSAYARWMKCTVPQRGLAFASYRAALDREDQAARVYSVWTGRLGATLASR